MSTPTAPSPLHAVTEAIEGLDALDRLAKAVGKQVRGTLQPGTLKDALSGTWLGHPIHPLAAQVVLGSFLSASVLDVLGGDDAAAGADRLVAVGLLSTPLTAAAGANDWADSEAVEPATRRVGIVHAAANTAAFALYGLSLRARRRGRRRAGTALGLAGLGALSLSGYLGGHLAYAQGVGVDQTSFDAGPDEWVPVLDGSQLAEGQPRRVVAGDTPVLVVRTGGRVRAIHDRCSHRGCSLSDGELDGDSVVCACHGSRFSLADGAVERGPAFAAQPAFEARESGGRIELRLAVDANV